MEGIEVASTIAPDDLVPSSKVLYRKAKGVKLDGTMIVNGKLTNKNKILDKVRSDKNIIKIESIKRSMNRSVTGMGDREMRPIADNGI